MIGKSHKERFAALTRAADSGRLCLLDCRHRGTGAQAIMVCVVESDGDEFSFDPLAIIVEDGGDFTTPFNAGREVGP